MYVCSCMDAYVCTYRCLYMCWCICIYIYTYVYAHTHTYICLKIYVVRYINMIMSRGYVKTLSWREETSLKKETVIPHFKSNE